MAEDSPVTVSAHVRAKEVSRTLHLFARTARARQLYASNNRALQRMMADLLEGLRSLLQKSGALTLRIRPDRLVYENETVLEEPNPHDSIPFALYRDGLRRLDFSRGVTLQELEALVASTAAGFAFSGLGDDIVSHLWKHDLEHIRYLIVDTSIIESASSASGPAEAEQYEAMEAQIDGLLQEIYGGNPSADDVGPRAIHLDAADLGAKRIAADLEDAGDIAPGFHPPRRIPQPPAYGAALLDEAAREDPARVSARAANCALRALHALDGLDAAEAATSLLRMFDAAVIEDDLPLATRIVAGVRSVPSNGRSPASRAGVERWLDQAVSEARIRHAAGPSTDSNASRQSFVRLFQFLQACGPRIVPIIVPMLGQFAEPVRRRAVTDLVIELGGVDVRSIERMLSDGTPAAVQEGLHLIARSGRSDASTLWASVEKHPNPIARIALLESMVKQPGNAALNAAARLLDDPEPRVRIAAIECLVALPHPDAASVVANAVERPAFDREPREIKRALLTAYAQRNGTRALHILSRLSKRGEGPLVRRETEEIALHAVLAAAHVNDRRADELLARMASSKNRRIRETAQNIISRRASSS